MADAHTRPQGYAQTGDSHTQIAPNFSGGAAGGGQLREGHIADSSEGFNQSPWSAGCRPYIHRRRIFPLDLSNPAVERAAGHCDQIQLLTLERSDQRLQAIELVGC